MINLKQPPKSPEPLENLPTGCNGIRKDNVYEL
jgi:hypothetical protein